MMNKWGHFTLQRPFNKSYSFQSHCLYNFKKIYISILCSQAADKNVTAKMYFRFYRHDSWKTLLQLQETFDNGTLLNSSIEVLNCSAFDNGEF